MKKLFIQLLIIAIICVQLSCSINREDKIHSFNVLYCKKNPSGLKYNNVNVIRYEGMDYSPKIEVCYINGELHTLDVYKSDGILSYTIEELKTDRVLTKYLGIPLKRTIIIQMDSIFDNGIVFACKNRGDSIIVNNDNEIIIYYKIGRTVFDSFQGKWQKKRAVLSFRDSKNRTFA